MQVVGDLTVPGLAGDVVIHRDEWGIPHARAGTALDAFFAQGLVQAEDRLFQLEYDRRRAYGQWAEVVGASALEFDLFARRCGLQIAARHEYEGLPAEAREVLDAFAAGVNAWLALGRELPTDLRLAGVAPAPWEPWDCCAVFLVRHVVFANWQQKLWRGRVAAQLCIEAEAPAAVAQAMSMLGQQALDDQGGSNNWALHGSRTASGKPLLAGDPHRMVEVPGVYTQGHLACDEFDAIGLSFVGVPGFAHFGHNERVAWCVTNAYGDYQDLYVERAADIASTRHEIVSVRDGDAVEVECHATERGPILFGDIATGHAISMRSTALVESSTGLSVLHPMLRACTVGELEEIMRAWVDPVNNLVSADVDGHISYQCVGRIPVRDPANARGPVPGTREYGWHGLVPYDELPSTRDPVSGVIVTANQRIVDDEYPYYLGLDYALPDRADRIHARVDQLDNATIADMTAVHRDLRSLAADTWVDHLLTLAPTDEHERAALGELRDWDRTMHADSSAAAIYAATRDAVCRIVADAGPLAPLDTPFANEPVTAFVPVAKRLWPILTDHLATDDRSLFPADRSWVDVLAAGLTAAVQLLRERLGDGVTGWEWGSLHRCAPRHPLSQALNQALNRAELDPPSVAVGGEADTVMSTAHRVGQSFDVTTASVARYVFDLADWDQSLWVVPLGVSGDATSPHFADQQASWAAGELVPMRWSWEAIEHSAESSVTLTPGRRTSGQRTTKGSTK